MAERKSTFDRTIKWILIYSATYYGVVALLALVFPAPLGVENQGEAMHLKPPWPYLWLYGLENWLGMNAMIYGMGILLLLLALIPLVDRGTEKAYRNRKAILTMAFIGFLGIIGLSFYAWIAPVQKHEHPGHMEHQHHMPTSQNSTLPQSEGEGGDHHH
jgi:quinol-cytochrome oxidoreductase complex cytochrome b subunit